MKPIYWAPLFLILCAGLQAEDPSPVPEPAPIVFLSDPAQELASVNGKKIRFGDIQEKYQRALKDVEEKRISLSAVMHHFTVQNLVTEKIGDLLILDEARKQSVSFSQSEFEKIYARLKEKFGSDEKYKGYLQKHRVSEEEAQQKIKDRLIIKEFQEQVLFKTLSISEEELMEAVQQDNKHRQIGLWLKISQIMLYCPPGAPEEEKKQILSKLESLRTEIASGAVTFADAARGHSEGASGALGGTVGWVSADSLETSLRNAIQTLKPGEMTSVLKTPQGVHLALLEDRKETAETDPKRQEDLQEQLLLAKKQEALSAFMTEASHKTKIEWFSF